MQQAPALQPILTPTQPPSESDKKKRDDLLRLWMQLDSEYSTWYPTHADIIDVIQPNRGAFWPTDTNRGTRKDYRVVNNTAQDRSRKLAAAMDTGITSEAREWFIVSVEDQVAAEDRGVREYCHQVQTALYAFISRVGFYAPNRAVFEDLVGPAIGLMLIEEDRKLGARCTHVPIGQYRVAADSSGEINLVVRRFIYTAEQMIGEFGEDMVSPSCRIAIRNGLGQTSKHTVLHVIRERAVRDPEKIDAKNKPWESTWLEVGMGYAVASATSLGVEQTDGTGPSGILRESGYDECPFYVPRWDAVGQNAYGTNSPGWVVLADTQSLQDVELGNASVLAQIMNPALNVPAGMKNGSLLPGAVNEIPTEAKVVVTPTIMMPPDAVKVFEIVVNRLENRINQGMLGDILFLLSGDQQAQARTAEEIRGKKEERLLQLGGVFARVSSELKKAIARFAAIAQRLGLLPEPPPQMQQRGVTLKIEFVNPLVTAQKAQGVTAIQQTIQFGTMAAQARAAGLDKLDVDEAVDKVADMLGVAPDVFFSDEEMQQQRAQKAAAQNAQQQAEAMPTAAKSIKDLSTADPDNLKNLLQQFGPYAQAQGAGTGA